MATTTCAQIIARANTLLQDNNLRWTEAEKLDWINESYRAIALLRPDASMKTTAHQCTGKSKQVLVADGSMRLRSITRNLKADASGNTPGRAIRHEQQRVLDDQIPSWHTVTDATNGAQFYIHDPMNPLVFYLYPTPSSGWYVEAVYTAAPATTTALNDPIALDEIYVPCVLDYLCYRAYSKDAEYTANAQLAQAYYQSFSSKLTTNMQVAVAGAPADDGKVTV